MICFVWMVRTSPIIKQLTHRSVNNNTVKFSRLNYYDYAAHRERITVKEVNNTLLDAMKCATPTIADRNCDAFVLAKRDDSNCPSDSFLFLLARSDPLSDKLLINIGVNKGYNLGTWTAVFVPHSNISGAIWRDMVCTANDRKDVYTAADCCGVCGDCGQVYDEYKTPELLTAFRNSGGHKSVKINMIAWDMNNNNLLRIEQAVNSDSFRTHLRPNLDQGRNSVRYHTQFFSVHAAASYYNGESSMPDCGFGNEWCSVHAGNAQPPPQWIGAGKTLNSATTKSIDQLKNVIKVPIATVDKVLCEFANQHEHSSSVSTCPPMIVDVLLIDTEGNDPLVMLGSQRVLQNHLVRCLIFEYHSLKPWTEFQLEGIVTMLDGYDYDCYFMGKKFLWRLSRGCWDARYEFHDWSNVLCMSRRDIWWSVIQPLVHQA
jgi:hypothetical protein